MKNTARKIQNECRCGFCNSEINSQSENQKYCGRICRELAYHERRAIYLLSQKKLKDLSDELNGIQLRVIRGGKYQSEKIQKRSVQFLAFCQSLFWDDRKFSQEEKEVYEKLISEFFNHATDADEKFVELIERALMAKNYVNRSSDRYIAEPYLWLNINCPYGLAGTKGWYDELAAKRDFLTFYKVNQHILAQAILDYCKTGNLEEVLLNGQYFINEDRYDLLVIYYSAIGYLFGMNK